MTMTRRVRAGWLTAGLAVAIAAPPTHGYAQGSQKPIGACQEFGVQAGG
jgi:hypothetical protein